MSTLEIAELKAKVAALELESVHRRLQDGGVIPREMDVFYVLWAGCLVFLMQAGFAMLEAGSITHKSVKNVLLKNLLDACVGALVWYLFGFGFAWGSSPDNEFIGNKADNFALSKYVKNDTDEAYKEFGYDWISFFFSYTFAAAASTIVSGAVAERCRLEAYIIYTCVITGFIYPVVVHWVWNADGFLSAFNPDHILGGNIDFAGSGVVHMTGGVAGLIGAIMLGPRRSGGVTPFDGTKNFEPHSAPLQVIGTFILWFGWYGFNCGSTLYINNLAGQAARVAVTTTMSAAMGGITSLLIELGVSKTFSVPAVCNGILCGLVSITAGCSVISPSCSLVCGIIGAMVMQTASKGLKALRIDDPLDAFPVHGACGFWGVLAVGLFAVQDYSYAPHKNSDYFDEEHDGGIFSGSTDGKIFGCALVALIIEITWVGSLSLMLFGGLKATGLLRVSAVDEEKGLDESKHGGAAYTEPPKPAVDPVKVAEA